MITAKVLARNVKKGIAYLRVSVGAAHKIIVVPDDVIPFGLKNVPELEVEMTNLRHEGDGWQADVEVHGAG